MGADSTELVEVGRQKGLGRHLWQTICTYYYYTRPGVLTVLSVVIYLAVVKILFL